MKYNISSSLCMVAVLGVVFCCISGARAGSITLSDLSNNTPNTVPAANLSASVDFTLSSTDLTTDPTVTVTVLNTSGGAIEQVFFNIPDSVSSAILTTNPGGNWAVTYDNSQSVTGFGLFDLLIGDGSSGGVAKIPSGGSSAIFGIQLVGGSGTISDAWFYDGSEETDVSGGGTAVVVGAYFNAGGNNDATGASLAVEIPEPGTLALLAFSMFMIGIFRCKLC